MFIKQNEKNVLPSYSGNINRHHLNHNIEKETAKKKCNMWHMMWCDMMNLKFIKKKKEKKENFV